jgi:hypothetical protein
VPPVRRIPRLPLPPHALVALSCVLAAAVQAQEQPGGSPASLTNPAAVYSVPSAAEP